MKRNFKKEKAYCKNKSYASYTLDMTNIYNWITKHRDNIISKASMILPAFEWTCFYINTVVFYGTLKLNAGILEIQDHKPYCPNMLTDVEWVSHFLAHVHFNANIIFWGSPNRIYVHTSPITAMGVSPVSRATWCSIRKNMYSSYSRRIRWKEPKLAALRRVRSLMTIELPKPKNAANYYTYNTIYFTVNYHYTLLSWHIKIFLQKFCVYCFFLLLKAKGLIHQNLFHLT